MNATAKLVLNRFCSAILLCAATVLALRYAEAVKDASIYYLTPVFVIMLPVVKLFSEVFFYCLFLWMACGLVYILRSSFSLMQLTLNFNRMDKVLAARFGIYDLDNKVYRYNVTTAEKDIRKVSENIAAMIFMAYILYLVLN